MVYWLINQCLATEGLPSLDRFFSFSSYDFVSSTNHLFFFFLGGGGAVGRFGLGGRVVLFI